MRGDVQWMDSADGGGTWDNLALSRVDGCPECVRNTEAPHDAYPTSDGYVATYHCADCGHRWSTAWRE